MISRRKFIEAGTAIALAAGVPLKTAVVVSKGRSSAPQSNAPGAATNTSAVVGKSDTLSPYTRASFAAYLNSTFLIKSPRTRAAQVKLIEINDAGPVPDQQVHGRECFSLVFLGAQKLPQDVYKIEHAGLGKFDLLLVPIGRNKKGLYYEAVINRLH